MKDMAIAPNQLRMGFIQSQEIQEIQKPELSNGRANKLAPQDRAFHDWYRFVLSFPPHLVQDTIGKFGLNKNSVILDPFCGTGTTLIEVKSSGISCDLSKSS
jgi:DNA modification methylase